MSDRAKALLGFGLAAGVLVALAEVSPKLAVGTAAVIGLGVLLTRSNQVTTLLDTWTSAVSNTK